MEVFPLWQQLRWYKYTKDPAGHTYVAQWPDSEGWDADVWTPHVPGAIRELALRANVPIPAALPGSQASSISVLDSQTAPLQTRSGSEATIRSNAGAGLAAASPGASAAPQQTLVPSAPATPARSGRPPKTKQLDSRLQRPQAGAVLNPPADLANILVASFAVNRCTSGMFAARVKMGWGSGLPVRHSWGDQLLHLSYSWASTMCNLQTCAFIFR